MLTFTPVKTDSSWLDRVQQMLAQVFDEWALHRHLKLDELKEQAIATSDTRVYHGLGRAARGRIIVYQSADARVWDVASSNPSEYMVLRASAAVTVKLMVF